MRRNFTWASAIVLSVAMASFSYAQNAEPVIVEINLRSTGPTGGSLDDATLEGIVDPDTGERSGIPFSVPVLEDDEREGAEQLQLTVNSFTGTDNPTINAGAGATLGLGINSGGFNDGFVEFDADFNESLVISFSQDLFIQEVDLTGLNNIEENEGFMFGDTLITDDNTPSSDAFNFITDDNPDGMFLAAGETLLLRANVGGVGVQSITVQIPTTAIDLLCDINVDGSVDFFDIQPFIALLISGDFQAEADCNKDGFLNFQDIAPFITILIN